MASGRFDDFNKSFNQNFDFVETTPYLKAISILFVLLFLNIVAPVLPPNVVDMFGTFWFRSVVAAGIAYLSIKDWKMAIGLGLGFMILINLTNHKAPFEDFQNIEGFEGPQTAIYPGCLNMTVFDLVKSFNNDKEALANAMLLSKVPLNVSIDDAHAGLISTYLLNAGYKLTGTCNPPGYGENLAGATMTSNI